jgi:indole-3-glycerol phosphate synthase
MTLFLQDILDHKAEEVEIARYHRPLAGLVEKCKDAPKPRPFLDTLKSVGDRTALIAEVKKASPSAGVIRQDFDFLQIAIDYEAAGATCLSVLTDERFFQGRLEYLTKIKAVVKLPLLRKDFMIDPYQLYEARAAGADAILLIVAALETSHLRDLYQLSKGLGMDVLVETHTEAEMAVAASIGAELIGINSRNLKTFATDLRSIEKVAKMAPSGSTIVAESGIKTADDVAWLRSLGIRAILVGETLMRSDSVGVAISALLN